MEIKKLTVGQLLMKRMWCCKFLQIIPTDMVKTQIRHGQELKMIEEELKRKTSEE